MGTYHPSILGRTAIFMTAWDKLVSHSAHDCSRELNAEPVISPHTLQLGSGRNHSPGERVKSL
jgi:hypothetical protein